MIGIIYFAVKSNAQTTVSSEMSDIPFPLDFIPMLNGFRVRRGYRIPLYHSQILSDSASLQTICGSYVSHIFLTVDLAIADNSNRSVVDGSFSWSSIEDEGFLIGVSLWAFGPADSKEVLSGMIVGTRAKFHRIGLLKQQESHNALLSPLYRQIGVGYNARSSIWVFLLGSKKERITSRLLILF